MNGSSYAQCATPRYLKTEQFSSVNLDELVKSRKTPFFVIPAKAGIQFFQLVAEFLDLEP
jgi:hypothetical protein